MEKRTRHAMPTATTRRAEMERETIADEMEARRAYATMWRIRLARFAECVAHVAVRSIASEPHTIPSDSIQRTRHAMRDTARNMNI